MNHLCVSTCGAIKVLALKRWPRRRIARKMGIDRETVWRQLGRAIRAILPLDSEGTAEPKPAIPAVGFGEGGGAPGLAIAATGAVAGRRSQCKAYRKAIGVAVE